MITAGIGGVRRNACVALAEGGRLLGVCPQERVTRVRGAAANATGLPDEALDLLLTRLGRSREDVGRYVTAEEGRDATPRSHTDHLDHHFAHACATYLTSHFQSAAIVVCDHEAPKVSVWKGQGAAVTPVEFPWTGPGFSDVYSRIAGAFGFASDAGTQRLEALARLHPTGRDAQVDALIGLNESSLTVDAGLERSIELWLAGDRNPAGPARAALAAALQGRLGDVFLELLAGVARRAESPYLCLGGSLFYHSAINTIAKQARLFEDVFVPVDPGNAGLSVGTALHATSMPPQFVSPFLGPEYSGQEAKETLDNCKLQYGWQSEGEAVAAAVHALKQGRLVGWFEGGMEWGPRALGARSILANPFAPYVLENLNRFLKRREPWRGYAISGLESSVSEYFDGPASSPFMEGDYRPRDVARFKHVLPLSDAAIRIQTVGDGARPQFKRLLEAFDAETGLPFLVNTSFNGFHEPIVCNPRDAVRVFYGSGLDLLVLDQFIVGK